MMAWKAGLGWLLPSKSSGWPLARQEFAADSPMLKCEPQNPHDLLAVTMLDTAGHHLGYAPRAGNKEFAQGRPVPQSSVAFETQFVSN